jgi:dihydroflavonol-4-reductase
MVENIEKPLVCITGITGYIGSRVLKVFLEDGSYRIRGTCRVPINNPTIEQLGEDLGFLFQRVEIVAVDLENRASIFSAIKGCDYVVHTAFPTPLEPPKDPQ